MTTHDAVEKFLRSAEARGLSEKTVKWYRHILSHFQTMFPGDLPDIPDDLETFIASSRGGDERRHGYFRSVRALYNFAERRLNFERNPVRKLDPPKRVRKLPRPIEPTGVSMVWTQQMTPEVRAAIRFILDTGARLAECHRMDIDDLIETSTGYLARIKGKGKREHFVPISYDTYHDMMVVVPFKYKVDWLCRQISRVFQSAGIPGAAHNLRHTFGTYWDGDLDVLQQIMGHSSITTTMIYRQVRPSVIASQHAQHSPARTMLSGQTNML